MNEDMCIGMAVKNLWDGKKVARKGWNGKDMYLKMQFPDENSKMTKPYIYMCTPQGDLIPYPISGNDILEGDWVIIE